MQALFSHSISTCTIPFVISRKYRQLASKFRKTHESMPKTIGTYILYIYIYNRDLSVLCHGVACIILILCHTLLLPRSGPCCSRELEGWLRQCLCWPLNPTSHTQSVSFRLFSVEWSFWMAKGMWLCRVSGGLWICAVGWQLRAAVWVRSEGNLVTTGCPKWTQEILLSSVWLEGQGASLLVFNLVAQVQLLAVGR